MINNKILLAVDEEKLFLGLTHYTIQLSEEDEFTRAKLDAQKMVEALIKETREDEHQKTWDNVKDIYDTTDYKKHIEKAIKETEQRILDEVLKNKQTMYIYRYYDKPLAYERNAVDVKDIEQLREKYKGV